MLHMFLIFLNIKGEIIGHKYRFGGCAFGKAIMLHGGRLWLFIYRF